MGYHNYPLYKYKVLIIFHKIMISYPIEISQSF